MNVRRWTHLVAAPIALALLSGCGGGSRQRGVVTGYVTDIDGRAVAGAHVTSAGSSTTSLSNGTFSLPSVDEGIQTVSATITINGRRWSGVTSADVVSSTQNRMTNVVVSDESTQGGIGGVVIDPNGAPVQNAKVFLGGPVSSTLAVTDRDGNYEIDHLPGGTQYTVTCSRAGYVNQSHTITVAAGRVSAASFALAFGSSQGAMPAPQDLSAEAWTLASSISRADARTRSAYGWVKAYYHKRKGLTVGRQAAHIEHKAAGRDTPSGSLIEVDLFWTYTGYSDLLGYLVRRGTNPNNLTDEAVLRDPLARAFFDVDPALTPDHPYYYIVHCLDTIDFPRNGDVGAASQVVSANPLEPMQATYPANGETVSATPTFQWTSVNGAATYQVFVWDRFPDLQNPSDPDGVVPVWPVGTNNPGSSLVTAPAQNATYAGPALAGGHTYYWMVVAADTSQAAFAVSQVGRFTVR